MAHRCRPAAKFKSAFDRRMRRENHVWAPLRADNLFNTMPGAAIRRLEAPQEKAMTTERQRVELDNLPSLEEFLSLSHSQRSQDDGGVAAAKRGTKQTVARTVAGDYSDANPEAWDGLIDRIKLAGYTIRETIEQHRARERQVEDVLTEAKKKLQDAAERVSLAEERMMDADAKRQEAITSAEEMKRQAEAMVASANERARVAEEQAETALAWLRRVEQVILAEFASVPNLSDLGRADGKPPLRVIG